MNYGKRLAYILLAGGGMMITIIGISYKTGYFPGHSDMSAYACMIIGVILALIGLSNMRRF